MEFLADEFWSWWLMCAGIDLFSFGIQRPEGILENVLGIVHLLDLGEAFPAGTE